MEIYMKLFLMRSHQQRLQVKFTIRRLLSIAYMTGEFFFKVRILGTSSSSQHNRPNLRKLAKRPALAKGKRSTTRHCTYVSNQRVQVNNHIVIWNEEAVLDVKIKSQRKRRSDKWLGCFREDYSKSIHGGSEDDTMRESEVKLCNCWCRVSIRTVPDRNQSKPEKYGYVDINIADYAVDKGGTVQKQFLLHHKISISKGDLS
ncbi:hypothetical protein ACOME3_006284 [Neoechinorhynchus agilis]